MNVEYIDIIVTSVMKIDNVSGQVTTFKLIKENCIHWVAAIKMGIVGRDSIHYINERKNNQVKRIQHGEGGT